MRICITGGTGFIGSRLALRCRERGDEVIVLGLENTPAESQNKKLIEQAGVAVKSVSVLEQDAVAAHMEDVDIVFHLAATQHEMNVPDQRFRDVNVKGTRNVLEAAVQCGVKRFVHGSTIGVYGIADGRIDENTPCRPENIYGVTKLEGEQLAQSFNERLPTVVIRIPEVYGPGDRRLLKLFRMIQKNRFFMIGSGHNLHHLIFIDDLIQAFLLAAEKEEAVNEVFLLAGPKAISTNAMVETIANEFDTKGALFRVPFGPMLMMASLMETLLRPLGMQPPLHRRRMDFFKKSFDLSWQKAAETLGYRPEVDFAAGVHQTAQWYADMGFLESDAAGHGMQIYEGATAQAIARIETLTSLESRFQLAAKIEPFDTFWEAPTDIEKGYASFGAFYRHNYLQYFPSDKSARILVISCGPGYMVNLLNQNGYNNVLGIDSMPPKLTFASAKGLNCKAARAFDYLDQMPNTHDVIFCEQEINHLTKNEIYQFLDLCRKSLVAQGTLIIHSLNGANPIVGSENLALNFDHFNLFTEKSLVQLLEHCQFKRIRPIPLKLYVFFNNPLNYVGMGIDFFLSFVFKYTFKFYGKNNNIFTKKIAAIAIKPPN